MTPCAARGIENVGPVGRNRRLHHPAPVAAGRSGLSEFSIHARGQYVAVAQHRLDGPRYGFVEHTVGHNDGDSLEDGRTGRRRKPSHNLGGFGEIEPGVRRPPRLRPRRER